MSEASDSKMPTWYLPLSSHTLTPAYRDLLENYANIPSKEVESHILAVREKVWDHYPYPSIGVFAWLDLGLCGDDLPSSDFLGPASTAKAQITKSYEKILEKLKKGGKFLDVGCMFAQDSRKLIHDGVPPSAVYCTDLRSGYFECGRMLFKDEKVMDDSHFIAADILDAEDKGLRFLEGNLDVINVAHVIHVFSIEDQLRLIVRFIGLLKQERGVMCIGRLAYHDDGGYHDVAVAATTTRGGGALFEHSEETFGKLWREAGEKTGSKWELEMRGWKFGWNTGLGDDKPENWHREKENGILTFVATRVE